MQHDCRGDLPELSWFAWRRGVKENWRQSLRLNDLMFQHKQRSLHKSQVTACRLPLAMVKFVRRPASERPNWLHLHLEKHGNAFYSFNGVRFHNCDMEIHCCKCCFVIVRYCTHLLYIDRFLPSTALSRSSRGGVIQPQFPKALVINLARRSDYLGRVNQCFPKSSPVSVIKRINWDFQNYHCMVQEVAQSIFHDSWTRMHFSHLKCSWTQNSSFIHIPSGSDKRRT